MGDPTAFTYITPSEFIKKHPETELDLDELKKRANKPNRVCCNCSMPVWKYGALDMCFTCVTGESDASDDYELLSEE